MRFVDVLIWVLLLQDVRESITPNEFTYNEKTQVCNAAGFYGFEHMLLRLDLQLLTKLTTLLRSNTPDFFFLEYERNPKKFLISIQNTAYLYKDCYSSLDGGSAQINLYIYCILPRNLSDLDEVYIYFYNIIKYSHAMH